MQDEQRIIGLQFLVLLGHLFSEGSAVHTVLHLADRDTAPSFTEKRHEKTTMPPEECV